MKLIPLTQGKFAMVDDEDFAAVMQFKWHAIKRGQRFYAAREVCDSAGKRTLLLLHRFLIPGVTQIDHRDGNGCNDQMENIRPVTSQQNAQGFRRKRKGATSKFRGVSWCRTCLKWVAQITVDGKSVHIGRFTTEKDAALAFDAAARKYRGEFAHLNFP